MASTGNGQHYQITFTGYLAQELKKLHQGALQSGLGDAYLKALERAVFLMQHDPWEFGELVRRVPNPPLKIHDGIVRPVLVEFAIHEKKPIVVIRRVQLLM